MKPRQRAPTTDDVIRMIRKDCERQAEAMHKQFGEALESVREGNALGALGAMAGIESKIVDLSAILKLLARTPRGMPLDASAEPRPVARKRKGETGASTR